MIFHQGASHGRLVEGILGIQGGAGANDLTATRSFYARMKWHRCYFRDSMGISGAGQPLENKRYAVGRTETLRLR